mgnify:CR=1 FL=1
MRICPFCFCKKWPVDRVDLWGNNDACYSSTYVISLFVFPNKAMVALHQVEIEGLDSLPPAYAAAVRLLPDVQLIKELQQYNEGLSGARVYLVYVHDAASRPYLCILKVAEQVEIDREILYSRRAREALAERGSGDAIPLVIRESLHPEASAGIRAVLLQLAHNDSLETRSLIDYLHAPGEPLDSYLDSVADLLLAWNVPSVHVQSNHVDLLTPAQALRRLFSIGHDDPNAPKRRLSETGDRLQRGGIKARHLEKSIDISFQGDNRKLPNPLYYAAEGFNDDEFSGAKLDIPLILGGVHGDLHSGNILFNNRSPYPQPMMIDFAKGGEEKPIFFDWLYLEFDVLYRTTRLVTEEDWKQWVQLIRAVTQLTDDPLQKPFDDINVSRLNNAQQRTVRAIMALRRRMAEYWTASDVTIRNRWLSLAFWLTGCYVGLNYARKDSEAITPTVTLMKYAALYYSACCLQRCFDMALVDPLETSGGTLLGLGPHRCLFFPGVDTLNGDRTGIYLSSTADHQSNLRLIVQSDPEQFKPRIDRAQANELLQRMRATRHFLCIIGREPESILLNDENRRIPPTVFECEAAIAHFPHLQDRWVLVDEWVRSKLESSGHPITRGDGTKYPDFVVEAFDDEKSLRRKVRVAHLRWQQDDGLSLFKPEKLSTLYDDLHWHGLSDALNRSGDTPVQMMKLTGLPEDLPHTLFWNWLYACIKNEYTSKSVELVSMEDNPVLPGFIYHLYSAVFRGNPPPVSSEAEIPGKVLERIEHILAKRNLCLLICDLGGYQAELADFCQQLADWLAKRGITRRMVFILEDKPLSVPTIAELPIADMMIRRDDFAEVLLDNDEGYMWNFVMRAVEWADKPDWEAVLFGQQDSVSPVVFLQNFAQYVRGLVQQDLS